MRTLGKEYIIVGEGLGQTNFNKMISLNGTAAYLWESVEGKDFNADDLRDLLLEKYEVEEEVAARDAKALLEKWVEAGLVAE